MRKPFWIVIAVAIAAVLGQRMGYQNPVAPGPAQQVFYHIAHVYDGDTVKLSDGRRLRLIGIDAPEAHESDKLSRDVAKRHIGREKQLAMGHKAMRFVQDLLRDQDVRLEYDVVPKDRYGRSLAYLYLKNGTFVNEKIIREGYAYPLTVPPNVKYAREFKRLFDEAREQKKGLWRD